jgi:hypothetical protein
MLGSPSIISYRLLYFMFVNATQDAEFGGALPLLQAVQRGQRPTIPANCPAWLANLTRQCWAARPEERIKAEDVAHAITRMLAAAADNRR